MNPLPSLSDPAYHIEAEIGAGGGSIVYKAWHSRLRKHVVLKRIKDESGLIQAGLHRGEADILKNLKHTYLPQLYDFVDDSSGVYTVIEFIQGRSFDDMLKEGYRFAQKDVIHWAEQLSGALAYLHSQKPAVLHSDIKPANVMLTPEGNVCLIDFNISLVLDSDGATALGKSHGYASPEQYSRPVPQSSPPIPREGHPARSPQPGPHNPPGGYPIYNTPLAANSAPAVTILDNRIYSSSVTDLSTGKAQQAGSATMDARSDIYSLGATMYHMLTGERPGIATGEVIPISAYSGVALSEALIYIIERCMERDPSKRFQSAQDLHDAIVSIHKLDYRWKKQRAKTIATIFVLAACLIASGVSAFFGQRLMISEKLEKYN